MEHGAPLAEIDARLEARPSSARWVLSLSLLGALAGGGFAWWSARPARGAERTVVPLSAHEVDAELLRPDGSTFTTDDLRGHWSIVYLGFTRCPDVCPATMGVLSRATATLDAEVLFVSVDPERDEPARVGRYAARFDPAIQGLGGSADATARFVASLGGGAASRDGRIDHSTSLFVIDDHARVVGAILRPSSPERIVRDLRELQGR